jgi:hypothetical protein
MKIDGRLTALAMAAVTGGAAAFLTAFSVAPAQDRDKQVISDAALLEYAASAYDKRVMMHQRVVLGLNHDTRVVAIFPCSDLCPQYTVRVIYYDVPLSRCSAAGGVEQMLRVPRGIGSTLEPFCVPKVLADHRRQ